MWMLTSNQMDHPGGYHTARWMKGYTLIEMIVVLLITMLLSTVSLPLIKDYYQRAHLVHWGRQLFSAVKFSRVMALSHGAPVTIAAMNHNWCQGVAVFLDPEQLGSLQKQKNLLRILSNPHPEQCQASWRSFPNRSYLRFLSTGTTDYQNGTLSVFFDHKMLGKIVVSQSGRVRWA